MKVKIKTWDEMVEEFEINPRGDIAGNYFPRALEDQLPPDRVIDVIYDTEDNGGIWKGWFIASGVIEKYDVDEVLSGTPYVHVDQSTEAVTEERGSNYGHPYDHFQCTQNMFDAWTDRRFDAPIMDEELSSCLKHITYLILDKLARAAHNPLHMDNFVDIQGYASLWEKCVEAHND